MTSTTYGYSVGCPKPRKYSRKGIGQTSISRRNWLPWGTFSRSEQGEWPICIRRL